MIEKRRFGRTGHMSTCTIFGAVALGTVTQERADQTMEMILAQGVNHIDVAADYGDAELRLGPWMKTHRQEFFLATKTGKRTYNEAWAELMRSLERLQTDYVDLWQMHFLVDPQEWQTAMGPEGALKAFIKAKEEGLVRYLGVTGHELSVASRHLESLERYDFDSVLLPYNFTIMQNAQYRRDFEQLLEVCQERDVAVQTIKSLARAPWGEKQHTRATWYEPLENQADIDLAVHWVLANPTVFLNTVGDVHVLPKVLDAAARFVERPSDEQMQTFVESREVKPLFT